MPSTDYSKFEKDFLTEINKVRTNPKSLIPTLQEMIKSFKGKKRKSKYASNVWILTNEGESAINEAIDFLNKQKPLDKFIYDETLSKAAADHVNDLGPKGSTGHVGSDKSTPSSRVLRYGQWKDMVGENIDYGSEDGLDSLVSLIVDDGVPDRSHRHNIFEPKYKYIGISVGDHKEYGSILVTPLSGGIIAKYSKDEKDSSVSETEKKQNALSNLMNRMTFKKEKDKEITVDFNKNPEKKGESKGNSSLSELDDEDKKHIKELINGKLASTTRTSIKETYKNGKKSSVIEKVTIDHKGKKVVETTETDHNGKEIKKNVKEEIIDLKKLLN